MEGERERAFEQAVTFSPSIRYRRSPHSDDRRTECVCVCGVNNNGIMHAFLHLQHFLFAADAFFCITLLFFRFVQRHRRWRCRFCIAALRAQNTQNGRSCQKRRKKNNNLKMISNRLKQKEATALCCVLGSWALAVFIQNKHLRRFSIQQDVGRRRRCWWRRNDYSLFMKYSLSLAQSPNWMCCTCLRVQNSPENPSIVCFFLSLLMPRRRLPACRCIHFTWISFVCCAICFGADWIAPFWQRDGRMRALANPSNEDGKTTRYY